MLSNSKIECPPGLLEKAKLLPVVRTAIVNAGSELPMASAKAAQAECLIEPVFFGQSDAIKNHAEILDWDISGLEIIEAGTESIAAEYAAEHASKDLVGAIMKGDIHTDVFLRKLIDKRWQLRTERRLTHLFHMSTPSNERALLITDAAVNVQPDLKTRQSIVENAVGLAHSLDIKEPKVAMLSATEVVSDAIPSSKEAGELAEWASSNIKGALFCGPLAFDLAVSPEAARIKKVTHPVAGNSDIIVVPEIVAGNALFKMMVYFMGACAAGVVLGAKLPILLTSRADPPEARLASAALASIINASKTAD